MEANGFQGQRTEWARGGGLRLSCVTSTAGGTDDRHHSSPRGTAHCTIHLTERTSRDQTNTLSKGAPRNYYQAKTQTTQSQVLGTWLSSPVQKRRRGHSPLKTIWEHRLQSSGSSLHQSAHTSNHPGGCNRRGAERGMPLLVV